VRINAEDVVGVIGCVGEGRGYNWFKLNAIRLKTVVCPPSCFMWTCRRSFPNAHCVSAWNLVAVLCFKSRQAADLYAPA
jgi:hypothetical protein